MIGRILAGLAVILVIAGVAWALWPRPIQVETASVERGSLQVQVEEEGEARIREIFTVSTPIAGQLERLNLHAGDQVVADQSVVAIIRRVPPGLLDERARKVAEAAVQTARAAVGLASAQVTQSTSQYDFAQRVLERAISLLQRGVVSQEARDKAQFEVDAARTAMQSAQAGLVVRQRELDSAEAALTEGAGGAASQSCCLEVKAPVSGRILRVLTESEQVVQAGTPLLNIGDPANLEIAVDLLSSDAVRLSPGAKATIDGWGGPPLSAELLRIEPTAVTKVSALGIEEQRTTATLKILAPHSEWERLGHGFRVVVHVVRWQGDNLLLVPIGALFRVGDDWAAFVVEQGRAQLHTVQIGERDATMAQVVAGLENGNQVVLHPPDTVTNGTAVLPTASGGESL